MRDAANILALAQLGPDYMGLIFYPQSKRFASQVDRSMLKGLSSEMKITGVFVNETAESVINKIDEYNLQAVQLHGQESAEYCKTLKSQLNALAAKIEVIKAFGVHEDFDFSTVSEYEEFVDFFLFDTKSSGFGGSGTKFNWEILQNYISDKPYFLSGGISADDVQVIKKLEDTRLYAVDLNSKFEIGPALKDIDKVSGAIENFKSL